MSEQTAELPGTVATQVAPPSLTRGASSAVDAPSTLGRYQIGAEISRGGMGIVYRAVDTTLHREVAFKVLHRRFGPESTHARRFVEEARIAGQLQHPGIPAVHHLGVLPDGRPFLAMRLIQGNTLEELLDGQRPGASQLVAIFEQACRAVGYAHAHDVIHRDLKPSSIMVGAFGEVQVMDWGLAKVLVQAPDEPAFAAYGPSKAVATEISSPRADDRATRAGSVLGTPSYMAPEQAIGAIDQLDQQTDVFGLGAILYVILTGQPPYLGGDRESTRRLAARAEVNGALARLDACEFEPGLIALCKQCLSAEKTNRPRDGLAVADAVAGLRAAADERARRAELDRVRLETQRDNARAEARAQRKRRRLQLALVVAIGLLLAAVGSFAVWRDRRLADEQARLSRHRETVAGLLDQCEDALRGDDAEKAALTLDQAERRERGRSDENLAARVKRCRSDLAMLRDLDEVDRFRWLPVGRCGINCDWVSTVPGRNAAGESMLPPPGDVAARWRAVLSRYGVLPGKGSRQDAVERLAQSLVRERLLMVLDLTLALVRSPELAPLLREADPDAYRDTVRDALRRDDRKRVVELTGRPDALAQPARFAAVLGQLGSIPMARRRLVLETALRARPGDLPLAMTLGHSYLAERPRDAARWFHAAVAAHSRSSVGHIALGYSLGNVGKLDEAVEEFREAIRLEPKLAQPHTLIGNILRGEGDLAAAVAEYREAIRLSPSNAGEYYQFAIALLEQGDRDGAAAQLKQAVSLSPGWYLAHTGLGNVLRASDPRAAITEYRAALAIMPDDAGTRTCLGLALLETNDVHGAIAELKTAVRLDPSSAAAHDALGRAFRRTGSLDGAVVECREANRLEPGFAWLLGAPKHDLPAIVADFKAATERDPDRADYHLFLGLALHLAKDRESALSELRRAVKISPSDEFARRSLADALVDAGDPDGACTEYEELIKLDPDNAPARTALGNLLLRKKQLDRAMHEFQRALHLDPQSANAHNGLGCILREKKNVDGAIEEYEQAIAIDPKYAGFHSNLGYVLCDKKEFDRSVDQFTIAIRLDPKFAFAHSGLGQTLRALGDFPGAVSEFEQAIRLGPPVASVYDSLGKALRDYQDGKGAIVAFREAVRLDPKCAPIHVDLADTLVEMNQDAEAMSHYQETVRLDPSDASVHAKMAKYHKGRGDLDGAIGEFRQALEIEPGNDGFLTELGLVLHCHKDVDEAIKAYKEAIRLNPVNGGRHNLLGDALVDAGDVRGAIAEYKTAVRYAPEATPAHASLARLLATGPAKVPDGRLAVTHATRACELTEWKRPEYLSALAAAYAEVGDFTRAIDYQQRALGFPAFRTTHGAAEEERRQLYKKNMPYRDPQLRREP